MNVNAIVVVQTVLVTLVNQVHAHVVVINVAAVRSKKNVIVIKNVNVVIIVSVMKIRNAVEVVNVEKNND